jgi:hypothetical protein
VGTDLDPNTVAAALRPSAELRLLARSTCSFGLLIFDFLNGPWLRLHPPARPDGVLSIGQDERGSGEGTALTARRRPLYGRRGHCRR